MTYVCYLHELVQDFDHQQHVCHSPMTMFFQSVLYYDASTDLSEP